LNGLRVGGAYRWQDKEIIGYGLNGSLTDPLNPPTAVDISKVYYGPALTNIDLWLGYEFKLSKKLTWDIQFNVKNLFAKKDLIPVSAEPNGTIAQYRIPESTVYSINNTLKF
jgi:outer membrane receptor protein involved in Fe transport